MTYIRIKKISNKPYAYLVESKNTSNGPRQKVKQYLGRVHQLNIKETSNHKKLKSKNRDNFIQELTSEILKSHGFKEKGKNLILEKFIFSPKELTLSKKRKGAVLGINEGFFCNFTLQRLIKFKKSENFNNDARSLAKFFLEAGLPVSQEQFIQFYENL